MNSGIWNWGMLGFGFARKHFRIQGNPSIFGYETLWTSVGRLLIDRHIIHQRFIGLKLCLYLFEDIVDMHSNWGPIAKAIDPLKLATPNPNSQGPILLFCLYRHCLSLFALIDFSGMDLGISGVSSRGGIRVAMLKERSKTIATRQHRIYLESES